MDKGKGDTWVAHGPSWKKGNQNLQCKELIVIIERLIRFSESTNQSPTLWERSGRHDKEELVCYNEWNLPGKKQGLGKELQEEGF